MGNSSSQEFEPENEKYSRHLVEKLLQVLSEGGFTILDEHLELTTQGDSQDNSSLSISGPGYYKNMNILDIIAEAYINEKGKWGRSPVHLYAETEDTLLVDIFLKAGADVDAGDKLKQTPLHYSARHGHKDMVEALLEAGANVNAEDAFNQTPLHDSARRGHNKVVEALLKAEANVNAEDENKQTPLHLSAEIGHKEVIKTLFLAGGNVDAEDKYKKTPLHYSARNGHKEVVEALLIAGANVNAEGENKQTPLHFSSENGHQKVVEALLLAGANVDAEDKYKKAPLHLSAEHGHTEVVATLLKATANFNAEDKYKQTPLHKSIISKHDDVTDLLLRAGASVKIIDIFGRTGLDYMDDRQKVRFGFEPRTLFKLSNWKYSLTNNKKRLQSSTCTKTTTEHTETISATFTDVDSRTPEESNTLPFWDSTAFTIEDNSNNNDQDETSRDSPNLLTSRPPLRKSAGTSSSLKPLCSHSPSAETHDLDGKDLQELSNIRQQVENHLSKLSLETTEGCETSCSHDVKAAFQAGRIIIPTTINITQNKSIRNIKKVNHHYEPGTSITISHAGVVAPGGQIVVHPIREVPTADDDGSSSEDDSHYCI